MKGGGLGIVGLSGSPGPTSSPSKALVICYLLWYRLYGGGPKDKSTLAGKSTRDIEKRKELIHCSARLVFGSASYALRKRSEGPQTYRPVFWVQDSYI